LATWKSPPTPQRVRGRDATIALEARAREWCHAMAAAAATREATAAATGATCADAAEARVRLVFSIIRENLRVSGWFQGLLTSAPRHCPFLRLKNPVWDVDWFPAMRHA
jgi:hypothetical protein